jgi:hypothetical protein
MDIGEIEKMRAFRQPSGLRLSKVPTPEAMEGALAELRDLERRAKAAGRSLATSPWASDGPWHLAQAEAGDVAAGNAEYSETLIVNEAGRELLVRKVDSLPPRTPLRAAEVTRYEELLAWLELLPEAVDRVILWEASFHLWRGEALDWAGMKRRLGYPRTARALIDAYDRALCKLVCAVNGVPKRHWRGVLAQWKARRTASLPR